jgi:V8-like Glu-specific endopeptidase
MAAILRVDTIGRQTPVDVYVCGGVLVSPSVVLTTAHNVVDYA